MIHMKNTTMMAAFTKTRIAAALMLALVVNSLSPASAPFVRPTHSWGQDTKFGAVYTARTQRER